MIEVFSIGAGIGMALSGFGGPALIAPVAIGAVAIGPVAAIGCAMVGLSASGLAAGRLKLRVIDAAAAAGSIVAVAAGPTLTVISLTGAARSPVRASSASTDIANWPVTLDGTTSLT